MCDSVRIVPILYGLIADPELEEKQRRREVIHAGCRIPHNPPRWGCGACGWIPFRPSLVRSNPSRG